MDGAAAVNYRQSCALRRKNRRLKGALKNRQAAGRFKAEGARGDTHGLVLGPADADVKGIKNLKPPAVRGTALTPNGIHRGLRP